MTCYSIKSANLGGGVIKPACTDVDVFPSRTYSSISTLPPPCPLVRMQVLGFLVLLRRAISIFRYTGCPHIACVPTPSGFTLLGFLFLLCTWDVFPLTKRHICILILPFVFWVWQSFSPTSNIFFTKCDTCIPNTFSGDDAGSETPFGNHWSRKTFDSFYVVFILKTTSISKKVFIFK